MVEKKRIKLSSEKIVKRDKKIKYLQLFLSISSLFLIVVYSILSIIYADGKFTINIDKDFSKKTGMVIYSDSKDKQPKLILEVKEVGLLDNISMDWLPKNINNEADGSHNGDNYIAYTFYVENRGSENITYWYRIPIINVIRNVDDAVRVMMYRNDEKVVYAKASKSGEAEKGTIPFYSKDCVALEKREGLEPGKIDKYTIILWLEGDDPECIDSIIGGELKLNMEFNEEFLEND